MSFRTVTFVRHQEPKRTPKYLPSAWHFSVILPYPTSISSFLSESRPHSKTVPLVALSLLQIMRGIPHHFSALFRKFNIFLFFFASLLLLPFTGLWLSSFRFLIGARFRRLVFCTSAFLATQVFFKRSKPHGLFFSDNPILFHNRLHGVFQCPLRIIYHTKLVPVHNHVSLSQLDFDVDTIASYHTALICSTFSKQD